MRQVTEHEAPAFRVRAVTRDDHLLQAFVITKVDGDAARVQIARNPLSMSLRAEDPLIHYVQDRMTELVRFRQLDANHEALDVNDHFPAIMTIDTGYFFSAETRLASVETDGDPKNPTPITYTAAANIYLKPDSPDSRAVLTSDGETIVMDTRPHNLRGSHNESADADSGVHARSFRSVLPGLLGCRDLPQI